MVVLHSADVTRVDSGRMYGEESQTRRLDPKRESQPGMTFNCRLGKHLTLP